STVLPSVPPGVVFQTFAIGAAASCDTPAPLGNLHQLATATGGTCTFVPNLAALPDIVPGVIAARMDSITLTVDGAPTPIANITPAVPQNGPKTFAFDTVIPPGLSSGVHTLCATAAGTDGGGPGTVKDCHQIRINTLPIARCQSITVAADGSCQGNGS